MLVWTWASCDAREARTKLRGDIRVNRGTLVDRSVLNLDARHDHVRIYDFVM